jgi:hypothetical protein
MIGGVIFFIVTCDQVRLKKQDFICKDLEMGDMENLGEPGYGTRAIH